MQSNNNTDNFILQNMQHRSFKPVAVYFKETFTTNTKLYQIYPDWTINQFINAISPIISIDFGIEPDDFELLDMGQDTCENGAALRQTDSILLRNIWTPELNVSFYIRRI